MTLQQMLSIAMEQSAEDMGFQASDFLKEKNIIVPLRLGRSARRYLKMPITLNLVSYGNNIAAAVTDEVRDTVEAYLDRYTFYHCFETPSLNWLNEKLLPKGHKICFMAEYYLPASDTFPERTCLYEIRQLEPPAFDGLYLPEWSNALCAERRHLDVLGFGAYDGDKLIGLAACSADCDTMWQIGVDVLPAYRRRGIASALTGRLAGAIMERGKIPFYCSAWSNLRSVRNAIRSGFLPAWVEMTAKPSVLVDALNAPESEARICPLQHD